MGDNRGYTISFIIFISSNKLTNTTMKVFMTVALFLAAAVAADAQWFGYGLHQQQWPGVRAPGFSSTCYGCRPLGHLIGKREAEADAYYGYGGYGGYGYGGYGHGYGYGRGYGYGHYLGKRSAEPFYGYGYPFAYGAYPYALSAGPLLTSAGPTGIAGHGTGTSYTARSPQGLRGKRSAEPYFGYGGYYGRFPYAYGPGIAGHPGAATSFVARSPQGLGK